MSTHCTARTRQAGTSCNRRQRHTAPTCMYISRQSCQSIECRCASWNTSQRASTTQPAGGRAIDWTRYTVGSNQRQPRLVKDVVVVRQTAISFSGQASACSRCQLAELFASRTSGGDGRANREACGLGWPGGVDGRADRPTGSSVDHDREEWRQRPRPSAVGIDFCRSSSSWVSLARRRDHTHTRT